MRRSGKCPIRLRLGNLNLPLPVVTRLGPYIQPMFSPVNPRCCNLLDTGPYTESKRSVVNVVFGPHAGTVQVGVLRVADFRAPQITSRSKSRKH